jgi:hypothetical protein
MAGASHSLTNKDRNTQPYSVGGGTILVLSYPQRNTQQSRRPRIKPTALPGRRTPREGSTVLGEPVRFGPENHRTRSAVLKRPFCGCVLWRTPTKEQQSARAFIKYAQIYLLYRPSRGNRRRRDLSRCSLNSAASLKPHLRNELSVHALSDWQTGKSRLRCAGCRPRPIPSSPPARRWPGPH